jgi:hypothetical protein
MNATETAYALHLELLRRAGEIRAWSYEPMKLRLADKTYYSPDFLVVLGNGEMELHETKGFWQDDARVKIKVAAEQFPWFRFAAFTVEKGRFLREDIPPYDEAA